MNADSGSFPRGPTSSSAGVETKTCPVSGDLRNVHQRSSDAILVKVKRRKTKRERNNAKFHKPETEKFPKHGSRYFIQKQNSGFHSFCLGMGQPAAIKGACSSSNPVIITQNRLSHHLGMFNREVKSVDIGRLLSRETEKKGEVDGDVNECTDDVEKYVGLRDTAGNPDNTPRIDPQENPGNTSPKLTAEATEPSSDSLQTNDKERSVLCGQDSSVHHTTTPASGGSATRPAEKQDVPVLEVAEVIIKSLNPQVLFPGRDLVGETRKSIMEKVKQYRSSNTSARRKLDYSSTVNVDICECSDRGQIYEDGKEGRRTKADPQSTRKVESKASTAYLSPRGDSRSHTIIKSTSDAHCRKKSTCLLPQSLTFAPDFERQGLHQYQRVYDYESPSMSKLTSSRAEPELIYDNRSRLQRDTESFLKAMRQRKIYHSHGTTGRTQQRWKCAQDGFQITAPHTMRSHHHHHHHSSRNNMSPNLWEFGGQEFPVRVPLQEIFPGQAAQTEPTVRQRSAGDNQTSYDVLRSIWSHDSERTPISPTSGNFPDISPKETSLWFGDLSQQRVHSGDKLHTYHGLAPGDFEPQPSFGLSDFTYEDGEVPQFESGKPRDVWKHNAQGLGSDIRFQEDLSPPTTLSQWRSIFEASHDEPWGAAPAVTMDSLQMDGIDNVWSRDWRSSEEWSDQYKQPDQLPITLFPPSESLGQENLFISPPLERSFRQTQLNRLSPDAWVFPRMKLY